MWPRFKFPIKVPRFIKWIYPAYLWDKYNEAKRDKIIYLTFDDGPTPEITTWVLDKLKAYGAKATFFLVGNNVDLYPQLVKDILEEGHLIGNHSYDHLNGWSTTDTCYINNVEKTQNALNVFYELKPKDHKLMRPPYGKIKRTQAKKLKSKGFDIIMYDVLAYDWDHNISGQQCAQNVINHAQTGSIVVFHDSIKAQKNLKLGLPGVLDYFTQQGYTFKTL